MSKDDNMKLVGAQHADYKAASGNTPNHSELRSRNAYKSKETPGWKKIEVPGKGNYQERKRTGTDVPKPPVLDLP